MNTVTYFVVFVYCFLPAYCGYYEENAFRTPEEIVRQNGYDFQAHDVTTEDNFILTIHRIQAPKCSGEFKRVVHLQLGVLLSSSDLLIHPNGLPYVLADLCLDVWIGNFRGNKFTRRPDGRAHDVDSYCIDDNVIDMGAIISYIVSITLNDKLICITHSQASAACFGLCSAKPDINILIDLHIALAPVVRPKHAKSQGLINLDANLKVNLPVKGLFGLIGGILKPVVKTLCNVPLLGFLCKKPLEGLYCFKEDSVEPELLSLIKSQTPASLPGKQLTHYSQMRASGQFCRYDYGSAENRNLYGSSKPPVYNLLNVNVNVHLFSCPGDCLSRKEDIDWLGSQLPNLRGNYIIPGEKCDHLNMLYHPDVHLKLCAQVLDVFRLNVGIAL